MGMCASIIAIGPYCEAVRECLPYPAEFYRLTRLGVPVVTELFGITEGSSASSAFASALGITDPWDFNQHKIDSSLINIDQLRKFFKTLAAGAQYEKDMVRFQALLNSGFSFYFQPNG
jgi:hypothetical protein